MYGIVVKSTSLLYAKPNINSKVLDQLLFGEVFAILDAESSYDYENDCRLNMISSFDNEVKAWIRISDFELLSEEDFILYKDSFKHRTLGTCICIREICDSSYMMIPTASVLPFYNSETGEFKIAGSKFLLVNGLVNSEVVKFSNRKMLVYYAMQFLSCAFVKGGRSQAGLDDAALVYLSYLMSGVEMPRLLENQALIGHNLLFIEEAEIGDLLFFGDDDEISHVGLLFDKNHIIHVSGKVRIDLVDHFGIYNEELKRYTHKLKAIRQL